MSRMSATVLGPVSTPFALLFKTPVSPAAFARSIPVTSTASLAAPATFHEAWRMA
jgi:hypothetical protein